MLRKLMVVGLVLASVAFAQRSGGKRGNSDTNSDRPTGSATPASKIDRISTALNLNKDQKKAVRALLDDAAKQATPLRDQLSKARIAIADAIQAKKSGDEVSQAVNAYAALATQMTSLEMNTFNKIYAGLDDTQKANRTGIGAVFSLMKNIFAAKNWNEDV